MAVYKGKGALWVEKIEGSYTNVGRIHPVEHVYRKRRTKNEGYTKPGQVQAAIRANTQIPRN